MVVFMKDLTTSAYMFKKVRQETFKKVPKSLLLFVFQKIALLSFVICCFLLAGCATTDSTYSQSLLDEPLPVADMTNAISCQEAGQRYFIIALELNRKKPPERERIEKLYATGVELTEHSLTLRLEKKEGIGWVHESLMRLIGICNCADKIFPNAPETSREYFEKAIHYLTLIMGRYLTEAPLHFLGEWEYNLAYLYYLTNEEEKAFHLADSAWGHKYGGYWNHDFWRWLKACIEQKKMKTEHFPPLRPPVSLKSRLLFPLNLAPDILSDLIAYIGSSFYIIGGLLTSDEPGWGIVASFYWPYGAVVSCVIGVADAWEGLPFWNTTIIRAIKKDALKNGNIFDSYEYFEDFPPR